MWKPITTVTSTQQIPLQKNEVELILNIKHENKYSPFKYLQTKIISQTLNVLQDYIEHYIVLLLS